MRTCSPGGPLTSTKPTLGPLLEDRPTCKQKMRVMDLIIVEGPFHFHNLTSVYLVLSIILTITTCAAGFPVVLHITLYMAALTYV